MMNTVNVLSKDERAGQSPLAVVASPTNPIGIEKLCDQNALQEYQYLHGGFQDTSMIVLDEETKAAIAVQQRLQQVNEVLQRLQSPLQCTIWYVQHWNCIALFKPFLKLSLDLEVVGM